ncbi:proto-oncogene tyrosine-protein kinase receptor Ret [Nephila pilipes]|uniref:Proto-oncogene tyrosine-protein kinase receptor Ret n=1 Tax=Nephila pilipes TaxID=299642 RepID=A0A8X6PDK5_NEPPI|nr:proto-oncogene tyrosine-protein kinase receptor Ret [Nephila pilipes]
MGIVFIKDPQLMPKSSTIRRNIVWTFQNETHSKNGTILLLLSVQDDPPTSCDSDTKWCSNNENQEGCINTCGKGSPNGLCQWRSGSMTTADNAGPTADYATCSPDLSACPDGMCDELEQMEPTLCPQDCARKFTGEVVVSKSGQGLYGAVGPCFCPSLNDCTCVRPYPSAEMRRHKTDNKRPLSTLKPIVEIKNNSFEQGDIVIETQEETSTSFEIVAPFPGLLTDGTCGPGCIVFASIVPAGLLLVVVVLVVTRRMRKGRMSKHKFVSSHISLSGVPSDYVDDRSNSAQESRNTPSETSSFGKASFQIDPKWDFPRSKLHLQSDLGEGEFGKVMKAQAWNIAGNRGYTTVAVKMLKENGGLQEKQDLITEFLLLREISHPNVVRLLGASMEKSGQFFLIVEFAEMGSLRNYLRRKRRHNNCCKLNATYGLELPGPAEAPRDYYQFPCERSRREPHHSYFHKEQLSFAWQIAKGMAYLSDMKVQSCVCGIL